MIPAGQSAECLIVLKPECMERYFILYTADNETAAKCMLGRWAANPELSFTWRDAAALVMRMRAIAAERTRWMSP